MYVLMMALYSNSALSPEVRNTPKSNIWTLHKMREVDKRSVKGGAKKRVSCLQSGDAFNDTRRDTQKLYLLSKSTAWKKAQKRAQEAEER